MSDLLKKGWHPKSKTGGKESWRGDFKGVNTVAGWMGKGKNGSSQEALEHQSAPLSTLKDPASFGPPPKRNLAAAPEPGSPGAPVPTPSRQRRQQTLAEEEEEKPPPGPYRADTTGLSTEQLPKPPVRRPGDAPAPPPSRGAAPKPKPALPPRLPPRQNSNPTSYGETPPPTYHESTQESAASQGYLNEGALDRLGKSGVSVAGFGIGRTASPPVPARQSASPSNVPSSPAPGTGHGPQLSELQSRFAKMSTNSAERQAPTTHARTESSSVANNMFQHREQAASGLATASSLNQKYGIADRLSNATSPVSPTHSGIGKKPPPPPPPKKKELVASLVEPPPIPLGSKPKF